MSNVSINDSDESKVSAAETLSFGINMKLFELSMMEMSCLLLVAMIIFIAGAIGNISVLRVIYGQHEFHTIGYYFIANLSLVELINSAVLRSMFAISTYCYINPHTSLLDEHYGVAVMKVVGVLGAYMYNAHMCALFLIALNTVCSVIFHYKYKYKRLFTVKYCVIYIASTHLLSLLLPVILQYCAVVEFYYYPLLWNILIDFRSRSGHYLDLTYEFLSLFSVVTFVMVYILIIRHIKSRAHKVHPTRVCSQHEMRLTVQFCVPAVSILGFWLLFATLMTMFHHVFGQYRLGLRVKTGDEIEVIKWVGLASILWYNVSLAVNPYAYMLINQRMRHHVTSCFCCCCKGT